MHRLNLARFSGEPSLFRQKLRQDGSFELRYEPLPSGYGRFVPYDRSWLAVSRGALGRGMQFQPEETIRTERQPVRLARDRRKVDVSQHLDGCGAGILREI